jgi:hypothetical protein
MELQARAGKTASFNYARHRGTPPHLKVSLERRFQLIFEDKE